MKALLYEDEISKQLTSELNKAREFRIAMALVKSNGLDKVRQALEQCLSRGGKGSVLVGIDLPTDPRAIESLMELEDLHRETFKLRLFESRVGFFHPKFYVFARRNGTKSAILGSSNLTEGGLRDNYEANIFVDQDRMVQKLIDYFDDLFKNCARDVHASWLRQYKRLWTRRKKIQHRLEELREEATALPHPIPKRIKGFTFAFTGKIHGYWREDLYSLVRSREGHYVKDADRITPSSCLVRGDIRKSTQKLIEASRMGLPIITEDQFFKIVKEEERLRSRRH